MGIYWLFYLVCMEDKLIIWFDNFIDMVMYIYFDEFDKNWLNVVVGVDILYLLIGYYVVYFFYFFVGFVVFMM